MIRRIRAEWIKSPKPLLGILTLLTVALGIANSVVAQYHAFDQAETGDWYRAQLNSSNPELANPELHRPFVETMRDMEVSASRVQSISGAFDFTAGLFASAPGFMFIGVLVAVLVSGEWSKRTATPMFLADPSAWRAITSKSVLIWLITLAIFALTSVVTGVFGITVGDSLWPLEPPKAVPLWQGTKHMIIAMPATLFFAFVLTSFGVLMRNRIRTIFTSVALAGLLVITSSIPGIAAWSPFGLVLDGGDYRYVHGVWDHYTYYVDKAGGSIHPYSEISSTIPLLVRLVPALVAGAAFAWIVVRRRKRNGLVS